MFSVTDFVCNDEIDCPYALGLKDEPVAEIPSGTSDLQNTDPSGA
jgi:hypothetical protein